MCLYDTITGHGSEAQCVFTDVSERLHVKHEQVPASNKTAQLNSLSCPPHMGAGSVDGSQKEEHQFIYCGKTVPVTSLGKPPAVTDFTLEKHLS